MTALIDVNVSSLDAGVNPKHNSKINFTVKRLNDLISAGMELTVKDEKVSGLKFQVGKVRSVFVFEKRISKAEGSAPTITLGAFPALSLDEARQTARVYANLCEKGIDPRPKVKKEAERHVVTVGEMIAKFLEIQKPNVKPRTYETNANTLRLHYVDWEQKDIRSITANMLVNKYQTILHEGHHVQAKRVFKLFLNLWKTTGAWFKETYGADALGHNPYHEAKDELGTFKSKKARKTYIPKFKIGEVMAFLEQARKDPDCPPGEQGTYTLILYKLFTGSRNYEARHLKWRNVDLKNGVILIDPETNKTTEDHWFPISDYVKRLLQDLWDSGPRGIYVFGSPLDPDRPINARRMLYRKLSKQFGIFLGTHGPRLTFASMGNILGIDFLIIKRMLNHAFVGGVTGGYVIPGFDPTAELAHFQTIADALIQLRDEHLGKAVKTTRHKVLEALASTGVSVEEAARELVLMQMEQSKS